MSGPIQDLFETALNAGNMHLSVEELARYLRERSEITQKGVDEAFKLLREGRRSPEELIALVDTPKSLIGRHLLFRRRALQAGHLPDTMIFVTKPNFASDFLRLGGAHVLLCYICQSVDGSILLIFYWSTGANVPGFLALGFGPTQSERLLYNLRDYAASSKAHRPDFQLCKELVDELGETIVPLLARIPRRPTQLVLIPDRSLHILPLHAMSADVDGQLVHLDELFSGISYASSACEMVYGDRPFGVKEEVALTRLAVLDTRAFDLRWIKHEAAFYHAMSYLEACSGIERRIVETGAGLSGDLRGCIDLAISCHAETDPVTFGGSKLLFADRTYEAAHIAGSWDLQSGPIVTLAACEAALDLSQIDVLDEYCGLDMAFRIAGARAVYSTLWKITDELGAVASIVLSGRRGYDRLADELTMFQRALRTGTWKQYLLRADQLQQIPNKVRDTFSAVQSALEKIGSDAFSGWPHWAAFRCLGGVERRERMF